MKKRASFARARLRCLAPSFLLSVVRLNVYFGDIIADQFFYIALDRETLLFGMVPYDFFCAFFDVQPYGVIISPCVLVC